MSRLGGLAITGLTALAIGLIGTAAEARDNRPPREAKSRVQAQPATVKTPSQAATAQAPVTPAEKAEIGQAAAEKIVQVEPCARKVKVIYSGYGEGDRASCKPGTEPAR